ncbi:MAG: cyclic nucleotide-binding domain-containing protein [Cyanobacteria bacterium P01_F01_bin.86]
MSPKSLTPLTPPPRARSSQPRLSLNYKLAGVVLLTIGTIAAIVHIPWAHTSRRNVNELVSQLQERSFQSAENATASFFDNIVAIKRLITSSLDNGLINWKDPAQQEQLYLNLLHNQENITWVQIGFANGDFLGAQRRSDGLYNLDRRQWGETLGELGEPGTPLAEELEKRAQQAERYSDTQQWDTSLKQPTRTIETYRFTENQDWQKVEETQRQEIYYAPSRPYYLAAAANPGENVWTDVYVFRTDNVVGLDSAITYEDPDDGRLRAVISVSFGLRHLSEYLATLRDPSEGTLFIVDAGGRLVAASDPDFLAETFESRDRAELMPLAAAADPFLQIVNQAMAAEAITLGGLTDLEEISYYDPDTRERYYVALKPFGRLDWVIGSVTPEAIFLQQVNRNQRRLTIIILVLLAVSAVVLRRLSAALLVRPIMAISNAANAVERGNFAAVDLEKTAQRNDELGNLAEIFQRMTMVIGDREHTLMTQLDELRDSGTGMTGSQLEVAYYKALHTRAAHLQDANPDTVQSTAPFPPVGSLNAYYRALKERAESIRVTHISSAEVEQLWRSENYLADLPEGDLRELASLAERETYKQGEYIFQEGDPAGAVYAIAVGSVEILNTSYDHPLRTLQADQVFGDLALMLDVPRTTSVRVLENTVVFAVQHEIFARILRNNPQVRISAEQKLAHHPEEVSDAQSWFSNPDDMTDETPWLALAKAQMQQWWQGHLVET